MLGLALALLGSTAHAQDDVDAVLGSSGGWQRYDWLSPSASPSAPKIASTAAQPLGDPFAVANGDALWQEKVGVIYSQPVADAIALSYESNALTLNEPTPGPLPASSSPEALNDGEKAALQFQPFQAVTLTGDVHDSSNEAGSPSSFSETRGTGLSAKSNLPMNAELTLGLNANDSGGDMPGAALTSSNAYDAQFKQPLGKLPLTVVLKGHYEETDTNGAPVSRLPSMEQSLVWKPADTTTVQMGLRQQQYEFFPGVTNQLNEAVFADWSQNLLPQVSWHSYAEVLDSRTAEDIAPAAPATPGTNGTAQSADPTNSLGLPTSITDETVTFSTGPSFKLDHDVSASIEYSNRLDRNPLPGDAPQEQRVSVSVKGSF